MTLTRTDDRRREHLVRIAFLALGWVAIALHAYNLYLFMGLFGK